MEMIRVTTEGFEEIVAMWLSADPGTLKGLKARTTERPDSLLALAQRVADRAIAICESENRDMCDAIYDQAVWELCPQWTRAGSRR